MTGNDRRVVDVSDVPRTPDDDSAADEIRVELRGARELLAQRQAKEGTRGPPVPSPAATAHPRLHGLTEQQLEDHVRRLERDLVDIRSGGDSLRDLADEESEGEPGREG